MCQKIRTAASMTESKDGVTISQAVSSPNEQRTFEEELLISSMNKRNDYGEENLPHCSFVHLTAVF